MTAQIKVIRGPARSGKTASLLARYRDVLRRAAPGTCLWLCPTTRSAAEVRGRLAGPELPSCLAPAVMTFDQFSRAVLKAATQSFRPLDPLSKRQLIARLIHEGADSGRLVYFAPIAQTGGLVDLVAEFIAELKRLEIWPDHFAAACHRRGATAKDRELAWLYEAYQQRLTDHALYDAEGRFWSARELLRQGQQRPFPRLDLVVVDGFTDFTRTQHEILELLARRTAEMLITLPLESEPVRRDLFHKTLGTLERLREVHPQLTVTETPRPAQPQWPALAHLERELFGDPRATPAAADLRGVAIIAASRQIGEIEHVGRRIKEWLTQGTDDGTPVAPGEIAVVFRSLGDVAPLVREVFDALGLPYAIEIARSLNECRALAALIEFVQLEVEDWPLRRLVALLTNNFLAPRWPELADPRTIVAAERLIRSLGIPSGRRELIDRARQLAEDAPDDQADSRKKRAQEHAKRTLPILEQLQAALSRLPDRATPRDWAGALEALAKDLGIDRQLDAESAADDPSPERAAWNRYFTSLAAEEELAELIGQSPPQRDRAALVQVALDILKSQTIPEPLDETGRIRVLSAPSARALSIPYLFVAGLSEKSFPPPQRTDGLYSEAENARLAEAGLPLVLRSERSREEMLLFYEVITRAERRLVLSYPAYDEKLEPLLPSPFLQEIERIGAASGLVRHEYLDLSPVPGENEIFDHASLRLQATDQALDGNSRLLGAMLAEDRSRPAAQSILAGLEVVEERSRTAEFGRYEGLLLSKAAQQHMAQLHGPERRWSPSHLESLATCPQRYYLERVLCLDPLDELKLDVDYAHRGHLLHEALAVLHRRLAQDGGTAATPAALELGQWTAFVDKVLDELLGNLGDENPLASALAEIDRRKLLDWATAYHQQHQKYDDFWKGLDSPPRPAHFEVAFGLPEPSEDPLSTTEPLVLGSGMERIEIAGRIDRIDVARAGSQMLYHVIDYKSGGAPSRPKPDAEIDGCDLQLDLYVLAVEALLADGAAAVCEAGYWRLRGSGYRWHIAPSQPGDEGYRPNADWQRRRDQVVAMIERLIHAARRGEFPVHSRDDNCTSYCPFHTTCRIQHVRALEKSWTPPQIEATPTAGRG